MNDCDGHCGDIGQAAGQCHFPRKWTQRHEAKDIIWEVISGSAEMAEVIRESEGANEIHYQVGYR